MPHSSQQHKTSPQPSTPGDSPATTQADAPDLSGYDRNVRAEKLRAVPHPKVAPVDLSEERAAEDAKVSLLGISPMIAGAVAWMGAKALGKWVKRTWRRQ